MNILDLNLTALEPLIISDGSAESMGHRTLKYIPGNMILGAYAFDWISKHKGIDPDENEEFKKLFLDGTVEWGCAYPAVGDKKTVPIPLSFQKIKNHNGLPQIGDDNTEDCQVVNLMHLSDENKLSDICTKYFHVKENTPAKIKKLEANFMTENECCMPDVKQIFTMHVAINEKRSAAESQLFGYSAIASDTKFKSSIICHDDSLVQIIENLISSAPFKYVGHSRSAGYGKVECKLKKAQNVKEQEIKSANFNLFFASPYIPLHSWDTPLEGLQKELEKVLEGKVTINKDNLSCSYVSISAFNGLWKLPKRSKTALGSGTIINVTVDSNCKKSLPLSLGGFKCEGYGRVIYEPIFLQDPVPKVSIVKETKANLQTDLEGSPLLNAIRKRSIMRLAYDAAIEFVSDERIDKFLDVAKKEKPSQAQRGNIRFLVTNEKPGIWVDAFKEITEKTSGSQWTHSEAYSPFSMRFEHLNEIMNSLLDENEFMNNFKFDKFVLLGKAPTEQEKKIFAYNYQRFALLELLKAWDKAYNRAHKAK